MGRIVVGRFGAPHGVRGEIRLQSFTADPLAISSYGELAGPDGRVFTLAGARRLKDDMLVARIEGVATREAAQALTHVELSIDRDSLPAPDDDEFYVADLVGMKAVDGEGKPLGTVIGVPNYGGGDLLEISPAGGGETLLLPFTEAVVPKIDVSARTITVISPEEIEVGDAPD